MSHLILTHDIARKGPHKGRVWGSQIVGPVEAFERSATLAPYIPRGTRRYVTVTNGPIQTVVRACLIKEGGLRLTICRGVYWCASQDVIDATLHQAMIDARGMPGRPANWPFPTWGGRA